jgi:hypothetical protein
MIEFLLVGVLLVLCPPLRTLLGAAFWALVIDVAWNWPT